MMINMGIGTKMFASVAVLDTGAGPNLIRRGALPPGTVIHKDETVTLRNASNKPIYTLGVAHLDVNLGSGRHRVTFIVCDKLATDVLLGCEYCDKYIEAIKPRKREVELDDGTTVPIIRNPSARSTRSVPLPPDQRTAPFVPRSRKIWAARKYILKPGTHTPIEVACRQSGTVMVQNSERLYDRQRCLVANGIAEVTENRTFRVFVANFSQEEQVIHRNQFVATANPQPAYYAESVFTIADVHSMAFSALNDGFQTI